MSEAGIPATLAIRSSRGTRGAILGGGMKGQEWRQCSTHSLPDEEAEGPRGGGWPGPGSQGQSCCPLAPRLIQGFLTGPLMKAHIPPPGVASCPPRFLPGLALLPLPLRVLSGEAGRAVICSSVLSCISGPGGRTTLVGPGDWGVQQLCHCLGSTCPGHMASLPACRVLIYKVGWGKKEKVGLDIAKVSF